MNGLRGPGAVAFVLALLAPAWIASPANADAAFDCAALAWSSSAAQAGRCVQSAGALASGPPATGDRVALAARRVIEGYGAPTLAPLSEGVLTGGQLRWGPGAESADRRFHPRVATDATGAPVMIHESPRGTPELSRWNAALDAWEHTPLHLQGDFGPGGSGLDARIAVLADGTVVVLYRDLFGILRLARMIWWGTFEVIAEEGASSDAFALRASGSTFAYAFVRAPDRDRIETRYWNGTAWDRMAAPALNPRAIDIVLTPDVLKVYWPEAREIHGATLQLAPRVWRTVWNDGFEVEATRASPPAVPLDGPAPPVAGQKRYETHPLHSGGGGDGFFFEANGLYTSTNNAVMAYVHDFGDGLKNSEVHARTRVRTTDNDGIALVMRLRDGRYWAAMVTDDDAGLGAHPDEYARRDGLVAYAARSQARPLGVWLAHATADAKPSVAAVDIDLTYEPGMGELSMRVDGVEVARTTVEQAADVVGVGILSIFQLHSPARADHLFVEARATLAPERIAVLDAPLTLTAAGFSAALNAVGEPAIAWVEDARTVRLLRMRDGDWQRPPRALPAFEGPVRSIALAYAPSAAAREGLWVATTSDVETPSTVGLPTPQVAATQARLFRELAGSRQGDWALIELGAGDPSGAVVSLSMGVERHVFVTTRLLPGADGYWEWIGA